MGLGAAAVGFLVCVSTPASAAPRAPHSGINCGVGAWVSYYNQTVPRGWGYYSRGDSGKTIQEFHLSQKQLVCKPL
jgi:hypothetical protein